jgi:uncharacterized protein (DUF2062 family)
VNPSEPHDTPRASDDAPTGTAGPAPAPEGGARDVHPCALIPVYNHAATLMDVVRAARKHLPVIVVDDGSTDGAAGLLAAEPEITAVVLPQNRGKGAALRAGFAKAAELGYTHAITLDADGQHHADDLPAFIDGCRRNPGTFWIGARDLKAEGAPRLRRMTNAFSNFWYWVETGTALPDTQTGFRGYPLEMTRRLAVRAERYAYELEMLVRAAWAGVPIACLPIRVEYGGDAERRSHFRPATDFLRISRLNARLLAQAFFLPGPLRALLSRGGLEGMSFRQRLGTMIRHILAEHAGAPGRLAGSVGLGLFCGIAPIWGFQMLVAAVLAHALRLNKAVALVASNVSMPLLLPFILFASLFLGHLILAGEVLQPSWEAVRALTLEQALQGLGEYVAGSLLLAAAAGFLGAAVTFAAASVAAARRRPPEGGTREG